MTRPTDSRPRFSTSKLKPSRYETVLFGTICGMIAAVGYTAANICLRAVADVPPIWVSAMKSIPTVVVCGPMLIYMARRGERFWPDTRTLAALLVAALVGQVFGNITFQWSLGIIGVALAVPITLGTLIVSGALIGRIVLHEPVSRRSAIALAVIISAIVLLSLGAGRANESVVQSLAAESTSAAASSPWYMIALAVLAACSAGLAYAVLGVVIRYGVSGRTNTPTVLFIVGVTGVVVLGGAAYSQIGIEGMLSNTPTEYLWMIGAGIFNVTAFYALTNALRLTSVVYVNALNASQAAMAAAAGYFIFGESFTPALGVGVLLTALGLLLMRKHESERRARSVSLADESSRLAESKEQKRVVVHR